MNSTDIEYVLAIEVIDIIESKNIFEDVDIKEEITTYIKANNVDGFYCDVN